VDAAKKLKDSTDCGGINVESSVENGLKSGNSKQLNGDSGELATVETHPVIV